MQPDDVARANLEQLIRDQANAVDLNARDLDGLWLKVLETEGSLIPEGLQIASQPMSTAAPHDMAAMIGESADLIALAEDYESPALMRALSGHYIAPVPGGDLIRSPEILPTGRNIHAFDPFRMPTAFAMSEDAKQASLLQAKLGRTRVDVVTTLSGICCRCRLICWQRLHWPVHRRMNRSR